MATENNPDNAGVITFPPLLFAGTLLVAFLLRYVFPTPLLPSTTALFIGAALVLTGVTTLLLSFRGMIRHHTTINLSGATTAIVSTGLYRYTRNPMYLSLTLIYIGLSVAANAWWGLLLLIPLLFVVQKGIIEREEKHLSRKFGNKYLSYKAQVRRWL